VYLYIYTYIGCILNQEAPNPLDRKSAIYIIIDGYHIRRALLRICIWLFCVLDIYICIYIYTYIYIYIYIYVNMRVPYASLLIVIIILVGLFCGV